MIASTGYLTWRWPNRFYLFCWIEKHDTTVSCGLTKGQRLLSAMGVDELLPALAETIHIHDLNTVDSPLRANYPARTGLFHMLAADFVDRMLIFCARLSG
jgi:hypothetical protein